ncbi:MAG: energy transducer TonB [bacterium]
MNRLRIVTLAIAALMLIALAGCGSEQEPEPQPQPEQKAEHINPQDVPDPHVGMRPPDEIESQVVDVMPEMLTPIQPEYPDTAKVLGLEGTVILNLLIDTTGGVRLVEFFQHAGEGAQVLDKAAVLASKKSQWKPATQNGTPVEAWVRVPIEFKLK